MRVGTGGRPIVAFSPIGRIVESDIIMTYPRGLVFDELLESQCDGSSFPNDNSMVIQNHAKVVHYGQERDDGRMCCVANDRFRMGFSLLD